MNYRHVYHAGNFADVFKHAIFALCIEHLKKKPAPVRVVDTHAGAGRYDLAGVPAGKTLEWSGGVGRLLGVDAPPMPADARAALAPWLDVVAAMNAERLSHYPGSPLLARALLRERDVLVANELHPEDKSALEAEFAGDAQTKVTGLDAFVAIKALLPPKERRGLVLVDPPFEEKDEFEKMAAALHEAHRRFATGVYLLWYPIKTMVAVDAFHAAIAEGPFDRRLVADLLVRTPDDPRRLNGCGMLIVNPPFGLREQLGALGPFLAERLAQGKGARFSLT